MAVRNGILVNKKRISKFGYPFFIDVVMFSYSMFAPYPSISVAKTNIPFSTSVMVSGAVA